MSKASLVGSSLAVVLAESDHVGESAVGLSNRVLFLADFLTQVHVAELGNNGVHLGQVAVLHGGDAGFLVGVSLLVHLKDLAH